jgi:hypothetical protein
MSNKQVVERGESLRTEISLRSTRTEIVMKEGSIVIETASDDDELTCSQRYPAHEMSELPSTRAEAIEKTATRYFTGKPCKHGHKSPYYTCSATCVECARLKSLSSATKAKAKGTYNKNTNAIKALWANAPTEIRNVNEREITDRIDAATRGMRYYWDPLPCKRGHTDKLRYTRTGVCVVCMRITAREAARKLAIKDVVIDNANLLQNPTIVIQ